MARKSTKTTTEEVVNTTEEVVEEIKAIDVNNEEQVEEPVIAAVEPDIKEDEKVVETTESKPQEVAEAPADKPKINETKKDNKVKEVNSSSHIFCPSDEIITEPYINEDGWSTLF